MSGTFADKALGLPPRVEDNLILYSDTWHQWDSKKPQMGSQIEAIDVGGGMKRLQYRDGNLVLAGTSVPVRAFRPHIWRYIP